jgi:hypothetical protein
VPLEPLVGLLGGKTLELDVRGAAARPGNRRVERLDRLVRRHQDEDAEPLSDQPVDNIQEPGQALSDDRFGVRSQELARVFEHEQAPRLATFVLAGRTAGEVREIAGHRHVLHRARVRHFCIARLREDLHQVIGVLAEERVRVDDVLELTPVAPLPSQCAECERLAGAGLAVPEDQLAAVRRTKVTHQAVEPRSRRRRVVRLDFGPFRHGHFAVRRDRPVTAVRPKLDVDLVRRTRVGGWKQLFELGE